MKALSAAAAALALACPAWAQTPYPCPSDPGFCYRDVADDGCFDVGTDEGPIDAELLATSSFDPTPPPGSIICPPSVTSLEAPAAMQLATPAGSGIRFYGKPKISPGLQLQSGADILVSGRVSLPRLAPGSQSLELDAEGTILVEASTRPIGYTNQFGRPRVRVRSANGDVVVGGRSKIKGGPVTLEAPSGNVTILDKVKFHDQGLGISAGGAVLAHDLKCRDDLGIAASLVELGGTTVVRKGELSVGATTNIDIDRLIAHGGVILSGHDVTLGIAALGPPRPSKTKDRFVRVLASGAVQLTNFGQTIDLDSAIETTGTSLSIVGSKIRGKASAPKDYEIIGGPGATCDLTGSTFKNVNVLVTCDDVVGP